eukprot:107461_1
MSAKNKSHGYWKLCDGSFLDSNDFPELFEIIAHSFGSFDGYPALFALPNARNNVLGMKSDTSAIGSQIGSDTITLNEAHLPSHYHCGRAQRVRFLVAPTHANSQHVGTDHRGSFNQVSR